jgi:glycoprotein endo-alpha-1,2-mannosidase
LSLRRLALGLALGLLPALLGFALWRIERDRPLAFAPALWSVTRPRSVAPLPRRVLAFHYPWYGTPAGPAGRWRHWNHARLALPAQRILGFHDPRRPLDAGRLDVGATNYPADGPYDSRDPARIRTQLADAHAAGLDGFVVSWWGQESPEADAFGDLLAAAGPHGVALAPYYETGELWPRGGAGVAADLEALLDRHGRDPAWLRVNGAPVIFLYAVHRLRPAVWDYVLRRLHASGHHVFVVGDAPRAGWLERFDGLHVYSPVPTLARGRNLVAAYRAWATAAGQARLPFMPAVAPGFDDRPIRSPGTWLPRADGALYDATWQAALAVDPPWVLVASWNEWHEGSEIEPSREYGRRYLEATAAWATRFRTGQPP